MANLTPTNTWEGVYRLETTDSIVGGIGGISNRQAQNLLNRIERIRSILLIDDIDVQNNFIYAKKVNTIEDLKNLTNVYDGQLVYVKGYRENNDGGEGFFIWDDGSTDTEIQGMTIIPISLSLSGRWKRQVKDYIMPEMFGAYGDNTNDDGEIFSIVGDYITNGGCKTLKFYPNKTYKIFTGSGYNYMLSLTGIDGVFLDGQWCTLAIDQVNTYYNTTPHAGQIFTFTGCNGVVVDRFNVTGASRSPSFGGGSYCGVSFVTVDGGTSNVSMPHNIVDGAGWGLNIGSTGDTDMCDNISVGILDTKNVWYGITGQAIGKNLNVTNLITYNVYRSFFPTAINGRIQNAKINVTSNNPQGFVDCYIKMREEYGIDDLYLNYVSRETTSSITNHRIALVYESVSHSPITAYNINFNVNIKYPVAGDSGFCAVGVWKLLDESTGDTVDRYHELKNFKISGIIEGKATGAGFRAIASGIFNHGTFGVGDYWDNISLEDLIITDSAARIDLLNNSIINKCLIKNVISPSCVVIAPDISIYSYLTNGIVESISSSYSNQYIGATYTPAVKTRNPYPSGSPLSIPISWSGKDIVTNAIGSSNYTFNLPSATPGLKFPFHRTGTGTLHIDPDGTEIIVGGGAGKYADIASTGGSLTLECFVAGVWTITSSSGTINFEA